MPRTANKSTSKAQIDRIVKRIVKRFHPEKIILVGSQARGDARPDSDIALLVVMDFNGSKLNKMVALQNSAHDVDASVDILVTQPEDFAWRRNVVGTIEWPASREGRILYARASNPTLAVVKGGKRSDRGAPNPEARQGCADRCGLLSRSQRRTTFVFCGNCYREVGGQR